MGLRGSITYRLTNSSRRPGLVCKVYTLPHEFHSPNLPHPNNNACDYSLPARDNYWYQVSVGIFWHNSHSLCLDQQIFTSHTKPKGCQFSDNTDFAYRSRVLCLGAVNCARADVQRVRRPHVQRVRRPHAHMQNAVSPGMQMRKNLQ